MSTSPSSRRRLAVLALPVAGLVALLGATACSTTDEAVSASASGSRPSTPAEIGTSIVPPTAAADPAPQTPTSPAPTTDAGPPAPGSGGGSPTPTTAPSTAPVVSSIQGPGGADCATASGTVAITVTYTFANAAYVEYLAPGSDRPGADAADGSVMFNYDCTQASQVFKIRAFNEFDGSDSKDPSPYVSVTVARHLADTSTTSTTAP